MLKVQNIDLNLKSKLNEEKFLDDLDYSFLNLFEIKQFLILGNFNFDFNGKNLKSKVELLGSINKKNSEQINVEKVNVWMEQDSSQLPLQFKDLIFQYSNKNYVLKSVNGRLGDILINGNAKYDRNLSKFMGV